LKMLGLKRALVVHGKDGLDEISISGPTRIGEVRGEWVRGYEVTPEQFGLQRAPMTAIVGGDLKTNADIIWKILEGEKSPRRDIVLMNAAAALVAAGRADSLSEAMPLAVQSIDSGAAKAKLGALVEFPNRRYLYFLSLRSPPPASFFPRYNFNAPVACGSGGAALAAVSGGEVSVAALHPAGRSSSIQQSFCA